MSIRLVIPAPVPHPNVALSALHNLIHTVHPLRGELLLQKIHQAPGICRA